MRMNKKTMAARFGVTVRTIERWVKAGVIPEPKKTPGGRSYWVMNKVDKPRQTTTNHDMPKSASS